MKISIKTLKGELFQIEAEAADLVSALKVKIESSRADLTASRQKLIHAGKVLKDDQSLEQLNISESDFIVCMLTKEAAKKPAPAVTAPAAPAAVPAPVPAAVPAPAPAAAPTPAAASTSVAASTPVAAQTSGDAAVPAAAPAAAESADSFVTAEGLQALTSMGFPEGESRAALSAAMGNPDLAYEFLLTGIPEQLRNRPPAAAAPATGAGRSENVSIEQLRSHPQFNQLKQLVQSNPAALSQVLEVIGQQSPALLAAIHANNDAFLAMMNEPITNDPTPVATANTSGASMGTSAMPGAAGMGAGGNPMADPAQLMTLLQAMPAQQRSQFAQHLGMTPEQLEGFMSMLSSMPPEQMQNIMSSASRMTGGGGGGGDPPGVIRLTEDEMAAVSRLQALGFSQQQAAQAYLACDKNEEQAANLLFDGGWGDDDMGFGGAGGPGGDEGGDDMYS